MAAQQAPKNERRFSWRWPALTVLAVIVMTALGLLIAALWLDSDSGHDYVVEQIEALAPESGLRIAIGEMEGSIYDQIVVSELELRDPQGRFLAVERARVDWSPMAWIFNELNIDSLQLEQARLDRFPALNDTGEDSPLLPSFDVFVGELTADDMVLAEAVAGTEQTASIHGSADIRSGRLMLNLDASTSGSADRLLLALNAEPDKQKLDLNADITAPAGGVLASYLGIEEDLAITLAGDGDWQEWDGAFQATSDGEQVSEIALGARDGIFNYDGFVGQGVLPSGIARAISAPRLALRGSAEFIDGVVRLDSATRSASIETTAVGSFDLGDNRFDAMRVDSRVLDPSALSASMRGQDLELRLLLNGRLAELRYQYLLTAPQLAFGKSLLMNLRAEGKGQRDTDGWSLPLQMSASTLIGNGELLQQLLSGFEANAALRFEGDRLFADGARVSTNAATGLVGIEYRPAERDFTVDVDAAAPGFAVAGIGLADIIAQLQLRPGKPGLALGGLVNARLTRFDNAFLRDLAGGLPAVQSGISLDRDGRLAFSNLSVDAPKLTFAGAGKQTGGAQFAFDGSGRHNDYGSFDLQLEGPLDRPNIALLLENPLPAAGLSNVRLALEPVGDGFAFAGSGGSTLGPFDAVGLIVTGGGRDTEVRVARLLLSETLATGVIRPTDTGLAGDLEVQGGGLDGRVRFLPERDRQIIRANLTARNARFEGTPPILIRRGTLDADILLVEGESDMDVTLQAQGISRGEVMIGRIAGNAKLNGGNGTATFSVAGTRGSSFEFQARADIQPARYRINGSGRFEGRSIRLTQPLDLRRLDDGWSVSSTTLLYGNGRATLAGRWGSGRSRLDARFSRMPLSLLDIAYADLGLGGLANGTIKLTQTGSQMPVGDARIDVRGLTRSGLILTSEPVDLGLNLAISSRNAAARGIIKAPGGQTIGRFQGRVTGLGKGRWQDELNRKPLFAQARFNGQAESLWRLTGVESFDLTGPLQMSADVGGTLANPQISGRLRTANARLESPLTGTVVTSIQANGTFDGSRLILPALSGVTKDEGRITGSGSFNFAVEPGEGVGIDLNLQAQRAALINRDDFAATVTGPIRISSSPEGGLIAGDVLLNRSFFRFGRAAETAALPQIKTREINQRADERPVRVRSRPWRFAINADVPNRLRVEGLGLDSEWGAKLRITGPVDNFAMTGNANLVRGNYTFAGRRFRLERGRIRFVGDRPPNPVLDIEAEADLPGLNASINVTGTGNRPEIAFSSVPALPQDELLSRILFGASIADLSAPEAVQLAAAVASLNSGGGLDPINQLRRAVGLDRLRILPSDTEAGTGTSIAAGKYITRRAYVELITDGRGYSATRLEFQITRWLSLLSSISTIGRQSANVRVSRDY